MKAWGTWGDPTVLFGRYHTHDLQTIQIAWFPKHLDKCSCPKHSFDSLVLYVSVFHYMICPAGRNLPIIHKTHLQRDGNLRKLVLVFIFWSFVFNITRHMINGLYISHTDFGIYVLEYSNLITSSVQASIMNVIAPAQCHCFSSGSLGSEQKSKYLQRFSAYKQQT